MSLRVTKIVSGGQTGADQPRHNAAQVKFSLSREGPAHYWRPGLRSCIRGVACAYCLKYVTAATQGRKVSWLSTDPLRRSRHGYAFVHILLESGGNRSL